MRAFLAFEVSEQVLDSLAVAEDELKVTGADVGVVARENLHFTVKFLGEVPEDATGEIDSRLGRLELHGFEAEVKGIGVFPDMRRPRIIWAGVEEGGEQMRRAAESVVVALRGVGKDEERPFEPHLTFGRVRSQRNSAALASFVGRNAQREFGRTHIGSLKLKSSVLTPKGPVYSDLREYVMS